jgi:hypothetical protein
MTIPLSRAKRNLEIEVLFPGTLKIPSGSAIQHNTIQQNK